eukprot:CAMPEP_0115865168 /NCGR_PEP_ID=MMETSP0287-20121206/19580_1 /TAXON_ID=412157 /ORGANISM="Chrysochromulina rotalis, Strain UIO044" /LENGTH=117 /DNA_ID=CAMNT_0003319667 /DNA_START=332 /DNA_END=682 /DNA_ORIENTATION=+
MSQLAERCLCGTTPRGAWTAPDDLCLLWWPATDIKWLKRGESNGFEAAAGAGAGTALVQFHSGRFGTLITLFGLLLEASSGGCGRQAGALGMPTSAASKVTAVDRAQKPSSDTLKPS